MEYRGCADVCSAGQTFDSIALEIWNNEKYAADLLCANPEYCAQQVFAGGEEIYLPVVEVLEEDADMTVSEPVTAPWRE